VSAAAVWIAFHLKRIPLWVWPVALGVVVLLGGLAMAERLGALRERAKVLDAKIVHDSVIVVRLDTVVQHDTIRLRGALAHYDTVRDAVNIHDTVAVVRFIEAADSAVHSCRETVAAFTLSCAMKDTLLSDLRARLALQVPPSVKPRSLSLGISAGYGATFHGGAIVTGPSVTAGLVWHPF
jgi:hypothetical protein